MALSLSLLGPFQLTVDEQPVQVTYSTVRALLGYLAVESDRPHSREILAALLWPDQSSSTASTNLRQTLARMRKVLDRHPDSAVVLTITRQTIQWSAKPATVDVLRFFRLLDDCTAHAHGELLDCSECIDRMQRAVELTGGDLLHGLFLDRSPQFEEWLLLKRELLHRRTLEALHWLTLHHESNADYEQMRRYAMRQVALEPWAEGAHMQAMRALALSGQRAAALAQYEACRRTLEQELGVEPSVETTALRDKINAGLLRPAIRPAPAALLQLPLPPAPATPLLGRDELLAEIVARFEDRSCRLLTLSGPGGVGKTHLALEGARALRSVFGDNIGFVSLVTISDAELVIPTIAHALGVRVAAGQAVFAGLCAALQDRRRLLVLDNFEQVALAAPRLGELLAQTPQLALLVTSRSALRLRAAFDLTVPPLALPKVTRTASDIARYPACALFVQRARATVPGFSLSDADAGAVAEICTRLDGLPLAIELAAARVKLLSPRLLLQRLGNRLDLLTGGLEDLPARQQTLRSTIEWSYNLLGEQEQSLFAWLATFVGGCTVDAVEALYKMAGAGTMQVLDTLQSLIDNSLMRRTVGEDGAPRFGMLETIREYALERLQLSGDAAVVREAYTSYYLQLAEAAAPQLAGGAEQIAWFGRVAAELDNFRAVLRWSVQHAEPAIALRLATALREFWMTRAYLDEGRQWIESALALDEQSTAESNLGLRGIAFSTAGWLAANSRDYAEAELLFEQSLALARNTEEPQQIITVLGDVAQAARMNHNIARAVELYNESLSLSRDEENARGIAWALCNLGIIAHGQADTERSAPLLEESLAVADVLGDQVCRAWCLTFLARVAKDRGDYAQSSAVFRETLTLFRDLGHTDGIAFTLEGCAGLAATAGDLPAAARLFGAAEALRDLINRPQPPYERDLDAAGVESGSAAWQAAWGEGRGMALEQAISDALSRLALVSAADSTARLPHGDPAPAHT